MGQLRGVMARSRKRIARRASFSRSPPSLVFPRSRRHRVPDRQRRELCAERIEEDVGHDQQPAGPQLAKDRERRIEIASGAGVRDVELQP